MLVGIKQGVERVEEFFLHAFLTGEELDVVNQQYIHLPVLLAKFGQCAVLDGADEFIGELFAGNVADVRGAFVDGHEMADGLHQVGLAKADAAVDEQRIVRFCRRLGDRESGGMSEVVVGADDK